MDHHGFELITIHATQAGSYPHGEREMERLVNEYSDALEQLMDVMDFS